MSHLIGVVVLTASLACAGRGRAPDAPVPAPPPAPMGPAVARPADAGEVGGAPSGVSGPAEPSYGDLMRGDGDAMMGEGPLARAELRRWLRPLWSLDTSTCPSPQDVAAFHACWCRLVCGVRFEARSSTLRLSWPYAEVDGPGLEIAPDGHVTECWHAGRGAPLTRVTCR